MRIIQEPKIGPAAARNRGAREAQGEFIAFIDDDCIATPRWLAAAVSALSTTLGGKGIVAGAITRSGARKNWVSLFDSVSYLQQENYVQYSRCFVTANLVMSRSAFRNVGQFNEQFHEAACEDWEWAARARQLNIPLLFGKHAIVDHPCMDKLSQLKRKAKRLGRGELMLRRLNEPAASSTPGLGALLRHQIVRIRKLKRVGLRDKSGLLVLGMAVAYWMWAASREVGSKPAGLADTSAACQRR